MKVPTLNIAHKIKLTYTSFFLILNFLGNRNHKTFLITLIKMNYIELKKINSKIFSINYIVIIYS